MHTSSPCKIKSNNVAFTLIELLIVTAIIAIIISMVLMAVRLVRGQAHQMTCMSNNRQMGIALLSYAFDNKGCIPDTQVNAPDREVLQLPGWGVWYYFILDYVPVEERTVFRCPSGTFTLAETRAMGLNGYGTSYGILSGICGGSWWNHRIANVARTDFKIMLAERWGASSSGGPWPEFYPGIDAPYRNGIFSGPRRSGIDGYCARASHPNNLSTDPKKNRMVVTYFNGRVAATRWQDTYDPNDIWNSRTSQWEGE